MENTAVIQHPQGTEYPLYVARAVVQNQSAPVGARPLCPECEDGELWRTHTPAAMRALRIVPGLYPARLECLVCGCRQSAWRHKQPARRDAQPARVVIDGAPIMHHEQVQTTTMNPSSLKSASAADLFELLAETVVDATDQRTRAAS